MTDLLFPFLHPWHWLTYGQNATALAAIAGIIAVVGVAIYTYYTYRLLIASEETNRTKVTPILSLSVGPNAGGKLFPDERGLTQIGTYCVYFTIRNVSEGPALYLSCWGQEVSSGFHLQNGILRLRTDRSIDCLLSKRELMQGEAVEITYVNFPEDGLSTPWIFVVESIDSTGRRHQLQVHIIGDGSRTINAMMVHAKLSDSFKRFGIPPTHDAPS